MEIFENSWRISFALYKFSTGKVERRQIKSVDDSDGNILAFQMAVEFFKFSPEDSDRNYVEIPFG